MEKNPDQPFSILPLGTSDAFCMTDYHTSALLITNNTTALVDCPEPIHKILYERTSQAGHQVGAAEVQHILLTHLHGDHANGLESFLFMRKFVSSQIPKPVIHCLPEVAEVLWENKLACSMARSVIEKINMDITFSAQDYYDLHIVKPGQPFMIGDIQINARRTLHSVPTYGFTATHNGRTLGYSGDTIFEREHIDFLAKADLIFHDCNNSIIHTRYEKLLELEPEILEKLRIFHMSDAFDREQSKIPPVEPGHLYSI